MILLISKKLVFFISFVYFVLCGLFAQIKLTVNAIPKRTDVLLDGKSIGKTPIHKAMITTGEHKFEINKNTIVEWKKRIEIKKTRVRKPSKINDDALREDVEKYPDAYQYERAARFNCGVSSIGAALKRLNITVKKDVKPS